MGNCFERPGLCRDVCYACVPYVSEDDLLELLAVCTLTREVCKETRHTLMRLPALFDHADSLVSVSRVAFGSSHGGGLRNAVVPIQDFVAFVGSSRCDGCTGLAPVRDASALARALRHKARATARYNAVHRSLRRHYAALAPIYFAVASLMDRYDFYLTCVCDSGDGLTYYPLVWSKKGGHPHVVAPFGNSEPVEELFGERCPHCVAFQRVECARWSRKASWRSRTSQSMSCEESDEDDDDLSDEDTVSTSEDSFLHSPRCSRLMSCYSDTQWCH
eukprot:TRINITY_DN9115_c0_g5_i1.p1 TRINITY_DN9115_c0_g5~~TRINITY_DN9115_c0_g5_i1.p1  ORF type:complete len:275 (+),score=51.44 TRINITY_DN9115_c0_g5_i1:272-1096(+)